MTWDHRSTSPYISEALDGWGEALISLPTFIDKYTYTIKYYFSSLPTESPAAASPIRRAGGAVVRETLPTSQHRQNAASEQTRRDVIRRCALLPGGDCQALPVPNLQSKGLPAPCGTLPRGGSNPPAALHRKFDGCRRRATHARWGVVGP